MARLFFSDILTGIGFTEIDAKRHELMLDALIANEIKMMSSSKSIEGEELDRLIQSEVEKVYSDYLSYITQDLGVSKKLLAQKRLEEYLKTI